MRAAHSTLVWRSGCIVPRAAADRHNAPMTSAAEQLDRPAASARQPLADVPTPRMLRRFRRHAWFFGLVLLVNIGLAYAAAWGVDRLERWFPDPWDDLSMMAMIGVLMGQLYLAALWLGLGGLHAALRFALVSAVILAGSLAVASGLELHGKDRWLVVGLGILLLLSAQLLLAPFRWLSGWRVDFDPLYYAHESGRRGQLKLGNLLALMLLAALPVAVFRWIMSLGEADADEISLAAILLLAAAFTVAVPCTWFVLDSRRRHWSWLIVAAGAVVAGICGQLSLEGGRLDWDDIPWYLGSPVGIVWAVLFNLVLLRTQGLQLIVIRAPDSEGAPAGDHPLIGSTTTAVP